VDARLGPLEVQVVPRQPERLTGTKTEHEHRHTGGLKAVALDGREQIVRLRERQGPPRLTRSRRHSRHRGHVAGDEIASHRIVERHHEHRAQADECVPRSPRVGALREQVVDVVRLELHETPSAERGDQVLADRPLVLRDGVRRLPRALLLREPPLEVLAYRYASVADEEPSVGTGLRLSHGARDVLAASTVERSAFSLAVVVEVDLRLESSVRSLPDVALTAFATPRHRRPLPLPLNRPVARAHRSMSGHAHTITRDSRATGLGKSE
jgi:hypothetical protein